MARKKSKKTKKISIVVAILFVVIVVCGYLLWSKGYLDEYLPEEYRYHQTHTDPPETITTGEMSIHFMELGVRATGDSILVKVGNTEVLIDAGAEKGSADTLCAYIDEYCTDGVLEYVIATHADSDHIAAFVGLKDGNTRNGILYRYEIGTLIRFPLTNKASQTLCSEFLSAVDMLEENGTTVYTALECYNEENGAKRSYYLNDEQTISMNILYNYYYEHQTGDENDYSVCTLFTQGTNHYLFTGDLEENGEEYLVEYNTLPKCKLFKAGHHGSKTSSNDVLLSVIQPEIICVTCCCGYNEYGAAPENVFPTQAFIDRAARYTNRIYVTSLVADNAEGFTSMNGNIVVRSTGGELSLEFSASDVILKESDWFKANRVWPSYGK